MKLKKNIPLVVGGAVTLVLALIMLVLLVKVHAAYLRVGRDLQAAQQRLTSLNQRDPYPSEENVAVVQSNLLVMSGLFREVMTALRQGQDNPRPVEPAEFPLLLERTVRRLYQRASGMKVAVPPRFAFGFDRYAAGTLPEAGDVPRLVIQLATVDLLCGLLFQSRIHEVLAVERPVFEASARAEVVEDMAYRWQQRYDAPAAPAEAGTAEEEEPYLDPSKLYSRERYVLTIRARDMALQEFLNALAAHPRFLVVTRVQMENEAGIPKVGSAAPAEGAAAPAIKTREDRIVAGRELVRAVVEVEVYRFFAPASGEGNVPPGAGEGGS